MLQLQTIWRGLSNRPHISIPVDNSVDNLHAESAANRNSPLNITLQGFLYSNNITISISYNLKQQGAKFSSCSLNGNSRIRRVCG
jgi:hypothetical protein